MQKFFKSVAAAGAGIALLGLIMCVISGVFFGAKPEIPNGKWGFLRIGSYEHSESVQVSPEGETIERSNVQSLEVEVKGGTLKVIQDDTTNSAFLILEKGFTTQNLKQKYDSDKNKWEIELDSKEKNRFEEYQATLVLPSKDPTKLLKQLEVDVNMGTVDIESATADKISLDVNMADVTLEGISAPEIKVDVNMGDVRGMVVFVRDMQVDSSMSDVSLSVITTGEYGYKVENKMGSVTIGDYTHDGFGAETEVNMTASPRFDVENKMGNVKIEFGKLTTDYNGGGR